VSTINPNSLNAANTISTSTKRVVVDINQN